MRQPFRHMAHRAALAATAAILAVASLVAGPAQARELRLGKVLLQFPAVSGYCDLDAAVPPDKGMLDMIGGILSGAGNTLIAMAADCKELTAWRTGQRPLIDNYLQYQARTEAIDQQLPDRATVVQLTCKAAREQGKQFFETEGPNIAKRIEEAMPRVKVNETGFLGVLHEDDRACYAGLIQHAQTETGQRKMQIAVFATTMAKGQIVYLMRYAPYKSGIIDDMLAAHRNSVEAFLSANGN